jgi:tetratricopeptide (TPR) repeat protein
MRSTVFRTAMLALLTASVAGLQGCTFVNKLRAKNELNEGVRTFNKGKYEDSQKMFAEALELDPSNVNAKFFYAMSTNALFEKSLNSQDVDKSGSIDLGKKTIAAFQAVRDGAPGDLKFQDRAISFIAKAYKSLRDQVYDPKTDKAAADDARAKYLALLEDRANLAGQTNEVKGQMYYTIGDDYWREAHDIVEGYAKRDPANPGATPTYPDVPADKKPLIMTAVNKSHEYMQKAIAADPSYPEPYLGEKLLYLEELKIADATAKDDVRKKAESWDEKFREKLSDKQAADAAAGITEGGAPAGQ